MQDWGRLDGGNEPWFYTWRCRLVHKLPKTVKGKEKMEIKMRRDFESAPAANRDIDSYKQPLLASSSHDWIDVIPGRTEPISVQKYIRFTVSTHLR
jgi:hypothetical protein